jgi:acetylornithine deacetylase
MNEAVAGKAEAREVLCIPAIRFEALDGFATSIVAYTTDIPAFGDSWGKPLLIGPGNIHVAHTNEERVAKRELAEGAQLYQRIVRQLLAANATDAGAAARS